MHLPGKRLHVTLYMADSMTLATCARRNDRQRVKREGIAQQRSGGSCMSAWFSYVHAPNVHTGALPHTKISTDLVMYCCCPGLVGRDWLCSMLAARKGQLLLCILPPLLDDLLQG